MSTAVTVTLMTLTPTRSGQFHGEVAPEQAPAALPTRAAVTASESEACVMVAVTNVLATALTTGIVV